MASPLTVFTDEIANPSKVLIAVVGTERPNVPDEVKVSIIAAATILDLYLPVPDSNTFLTQDHVDYLKAFLTGLRNGCDSFTSKIIVNPKDIKKSWIHE